MKGQSTGYQRLIIEREPIDTEEKEAEVQADLIEDNIKNIVKRKFN